MMKVYKVSYVNLGSNIVYEGWEDAAEEIKAHLESGMEVGDSIHLTIDEMEKEQYESIPEFKGF